MHQIHQDSFHIDSFSVDASGKLSLPVLLSFFQESAYRHAETLELGYSHLGERSQFWVISRLCLRCSRFPLWGEDVRLSTWSKGISRMFALRDFILEDRDGSHLVTGTSSWLVLDARTRRLQRLEPLFVGMSIEADRHAIREEAGKIPAPENPVLSAAYRVRYSDIDVNGHMNNARYVQCVLDGYSFDHFQVNRLAVLEINFLAETLYDDELSVYSTFGSVSGAGEREDLHQLTRVSDGKELCRIRMVWGSTAP